MEKKLISKMIDRCLLDYFGDLRLSPMSDDEYEVLVQDVSSGIEKQQGEDVYAIVHDKVYSYISDNE